MHKGIVYELEPAVRSFMGEAFYPGWAAKTYEVPHVTWPLHTGGPAPAGSFSNVTLQGINATPPASFEYYEVFFWTGKVVQLGFRAFLNTRTQVRLRSVCKVNGVNQTVQTNGFNNAGTWNGIAYHVGWWQPAPGAILFPDMGFFGFVAKPY